MVDLTQGDGKCITRHRALQDQTWRERMAMQCLLTDVSPCMAWTKASTKLSHGHVQAGYIGLGSQPDTNYCTALGPELNLTWLGLSLPWVCSEISNTTYISHRHGKFVCRI